MSLNWHVVAAVFRRNFFAYFSNPIGYLFITAFVWASAYFAFWHNDAFFAANLANLDQLNYYLPFVLLFFIPAITMSVWAEERRAGTEELLLTLPATDHDIVAGKYLACVAIYTVALLFAAVGNISVLVYLGKPDIGLLFSTHFGYWLIGCALLSAGMVASLLTANVTIAFILGCAFCLALLYVHEVGLVLGGSLREWFEKADLFTQFKPFGEGLLSIASILYYIAVILVMLFLNSVLLSRRHWAGSRQAPALWAHYLIRAGAVMVGVISATVLVDRAEGFLSDRFFSLRIDLTQEKLHTLSPKTRELLRTIDPKQPVFVEAFISRDVPKEYVKTKKDLEDMLRRMDELGGSKIEVVIRYPERLSDEAAAAERVYGIQPELVTEVESSRVGAKEIFLGVAMNSGLNRKVLKFVYPGMGVEYELAALLRAVTEKTRRRVGVLTTDVSLFGELNMRRITTDREWQILEELRQQYEVVRVSPESTITENLNVLLVPQPSSLSPPQMDNLFEYITAGKPTLLLEDPFPLVAPQLATLAPKMPSQNAMFGQQPPSVPKGDFQRILTALNLEAVARPVPKEPWRQQEEAFDRVDSANVVAQFWNPHPRFADLPAEIVFIGSGSGNPNAFNPKQPVSSGLQEMVLFMAGALKPKGGGGPEFSPLLQTGNNVQLTNWVTLIDPETRQLSRRPQRVNWSVGEQGGLVVAGYVHGLFSQNVMQQRKQLEAAKAVPETTGKAPAVDNSPVRPTEAKVIVLTDLDMISDQFFALRKQSDEELRFDNITFLLNCVDFLADDPAVIDLRKHRSRRRTLDRLVQMTQQATRDLQDFEQKANEEAKARIEEINTNLQRKVRELMAQKNVPQHELQAQLGFYAQQQERTFDEAKKRIERELREKVEQRRQDYERQVREDQRRIKIRSVLIPPIPVLLIGLIVFLVRLSKEREGVDPRRRV